MDDILIGEGRVQVSLFDRASSESFTVITQHKTLEIDLAGRTQAVLADRATPCLRPPYGSIDAFTREWAASAGLDLVLWTVDTTTGEGAGPRSSPTASCGAPPMRRSC